MRPQRLEALRAWAENSETSLEVSEPWLGASEGWLEASVGWLEALHMTSEAWFEAVES